MLEPNFFYRNLTRNRVDEIRLAKFDSKINSKPRPVSWKISQKLIAFSDFSHLQRKTGFKVEPKVLTLSLSLFYKNLNPSKCFQTMFLFPEILPLTRTSAILHYIWGSRAQKITQKGTFCGC